MKRFSETGERSGVARGPARDVALGLGAVVAVSGFLAGLGPSKESGAVWMLSVCIAWPLLFWGARRPNPSPTVGDRISGVVWASSTSTGAATST